MVSDFMGKHNGYLAMTDEQYKNALKKEKIKKEAWVLLEYGESKEGYWTLQKFMTQIEDVVKITVYWVALE